MTTVPWIRLFTSWPRHRKTLVLRRELGTGEPIITLWCWCAENAPTGNLSGLSDAEIEWACDWRGEPGKCVAALVRCGWLDVSANGEKMLHEWEDGAGAGIVGYLRRTERQRELMRARRAGLSRTPSPDPEREDQEEEEEEERDVNVGAHVSANKRKKAEQSEAFCRFWAAYPRKVSKGQAIKAWPGDELIEPIIAALTWQAPTWKDPLFIKHPATWLRARCWEDQKPEVGKQTPSRDPSRGHFSATTDPPLRTGRLALP